MNTRLSYMKKMNVFLLSWIVFAPISSVAQTFQAAIVGGVNASQVNGDLIAGFDKLGIHGGLKVMVDLKDHLEASVELLYSERGSSSKIRAFDPFKIKINYVEIPLMVAFKDWQRDDYYKMRFEGGASFGRLLNGSIDNANGDLSVSEFSQTDFSGIVGATFYSSRNLAFSIRYNHSINFLVNNQRHPRFPRLRGYFLTFRILYLL